MATRRRRSRRAALGGAAAGTAVGLGLLFGAHAGLRPRAESEPAGPTARTAAGVPDLNGLWAGPSGTPLETPPPHTSAPPGLAAAIARRQATATGFALVPGRREPHGTQLLVESGRLQPAAIVALHRKDQARLARGESDSWLDRNSWERCLTRGLPPTALPEAQADRRLIVQSESVVAILSEALHETRLIATRARPAKTLLPRSRGPRTTRPRTPRQRLGRSIGHWDGDTLVAVTKRLRMPTDEPWPAAAEPLPGQHPGSGVGTRIVERWTPLDARRIVYTMRVEDARVHVRPQVYRFTLHREPADAALYEYACHEGNRSMLGMLARARADERASRAASRAGVAVRAFAGRPGMDPHGPAHAGRQRIRLRERRGSKHGTS